MTDKSTCNKFPILKVLVSTKRKMGKIRIEENEEDARDGEDKEVAEDKDCGAKEQPSRLTPWPLPSSLVKYTVQCTSVFLST